MPPPPPEHNVFVANIPNSATTRTLREHMASSGDIVDVRLVIKQGKKPFAFVSFSTEAEAKAAVKAFHHSELWGCRLNVELAKSEIRKNEIRNRPWTNHDKGHHNDEDDNYHYEPSIDNDRDQRFLPAGDSDNHQDSDERTVYVFDINFATRRGALRKFGERIGPVEEAEIYFEDRKSTGTGYIRFKSTDDARRALGSLDGGLLEGDSVILRPIRTTREVHRGGSADRDVSGRLVIYLNNISPMAETEPLRKVFEAYGTIRRLDLVKNARGENKGFGFLEFEEPTAAETLLADKPVIIVDDLRIGMHMSKDSLRFPHDGGAKRDPRVMSRVDDEYSRRVYRRSRSPPGRYERSPVRARSRSLSSERDRLNRPARTYSIDNDRLSRTSSDLAFNPATQYPPPVPAPHSFSAGGMPPHNMHGYPPMPPGQILQMMPQIPFPGMYPGAPMMNPMAAAIMNLPPYLQMAIANSLNSMQQQPPQGQQPPNFHPGNPMGNVMSQMNPVAPPYSFPPPKGPYNNNNNNGNQNPPPAPK